MIEHIFLYLYFKHCIVLKSSSPVTENTDQKAFCIGISRHSFVLDINLLYNYSVMSDVCDPLSNMAAFSWLPMPTFTRRHPCKLFSLIKKKWTMSFGFWTLCSTILSSRFSLGTLDWILWNLVGLGH